ncbi:protein of unknown function [Ruminococcaceae bacterium BL-4]|nr:protein of unknown function [Ruminococcaceae bacterium BL-4]
MLFIRQLFFINKKREALKKIINKYREKITAILYESLENEFHKSPIFTIYYIKYELNGNKSTRNFL